MPCCISADCIDMHPLRRAVLTQRLSRVAWCSLAGPTSMVNAVQVHVAAANRARPRGTPKLETYVDTWQM